MEYHCTWERILTGKILIFSHSPTGILKIGMTLFFWISHGLVQIIYYNFRKTYILKWKLFLFCSSHSKKGEKLWIIHGHVRNNFRIKKEMKITPFYNSHGKNGEALNAFPIFGQERKSMRSNLLENCKKLTN